MKGPGQTLHLQHKPGFSYYLVQKLSSHELFLPLWLFSDNYMSIHLGIVWWSFSGMEDFCLLMEVYQKNLYLCLPVPQSSRILQQRVFGTQVGSNFNIIILLHPYILHLVISLSKEDCSKELCWSDLPRTVLNGSAGVVCKSVSHYVCIWGQQIFPPKSRGVRESLCFSAFGRLVAV